LLEDMSDMGITVRPLRETMGETVVQALRVFRQIHGHGAGNAGNGQVQGDAQVQGQGQGQGQGAGKLYVPFGFVVPPEEPWPRAAWHLRLGNKVNAIRCKGTYPQYHGQFQEMGVL
jgi:hypothetical protein